MKTLLCLQPEMPTLSFLFQKIQKLKDHELLLIVHVTETFAFSHLLRQYQVIN